MRPYRGPLREQGVFFAVQSSADCITNMSGFDLRQTQPVTQDAARLNGRLQILRRESVSSQRNVCEAHPVEKRMATESDNLRHGPLGPKRRETTSQCSSTEVRSLISKYDDIAPHWGAMRGGPIH